MYTKKELNEYSLYDLRELGSVIGVKAPTGLKKKDLINAIIDVDSGKVAPYFSKFGKPKMKKLSITQTKNSEDVCKIEVGDTVEKQVDQALEPLRNLLIRFGKKDS